MIFNPIDPFSLILDLFYPSFSQNLKSDCFLLAEHGYRNFGEVPPPLSPICGFFPLTIFTSGTTQAMSIRMISQCLASKFHKRQKLNTAEERKKISVLIYHRSIYSRYISIFGQMIGVNEVVDCWGDFKKYLSIFLA